MKFFVFFAVLIVFASASSYKAFTPLKNIAKLVSRNVGDAVFTPHQLPCSYGVMMKGAFTANNVSTNVVEEFYMDGEIEIFSVKANVPEAKYYTQRVYRMDLPFTQGGDTYVPYYESSTGESCESNQELQDEAKSDIEGPTILFTEKQSYQSVSESVFKGKTCKMYYIRSSDTEIHVYVDDDNYVIGLMQITESSYQTSTTLLEVSYDFNIAMDAFTMDRSLFPDCDQKAYVAPTDQCNP